MLPLSPHHPIVTRTWDRLQQLATLSDDPGCLTRVFLSAGSRRASAQLEQWMQQAGLHTQHDALGNVRGRFEVPTCTESPLVFGSHYDTVINAGKYDGTLGILTALAALELREEFPTPLQRPIDLLAFADEEGVRFQATYLGSRACTGTLSRELLDRRDAHHLTLAEVIATEGRHLQAQPILYSRDTIAAYLEIHIEQGPVLQESHQALGVVPSICGQTRAKVILQGSTAHAGTTPMLLRRDALTAAAECILTIENFALLHPPLVATVGRIETSPGVANSIPGETCFTLDVRHPDDTARHLALTTIQQQFATIAQKRHLTLSFEIVQQTPAVSSDPSWTQRWITAIESLGFPSPPLIPSGAGHDAVVFAEIAPVAMLFVRCRDGLSHHPDEHITQEDLAAAISATAACLLSWNQEAHLSL